MLALYQALANDLRNFLRPIIRDAVKEALPSISIADRDRPSKMWLTNAEAMEYLGLSRPTLARYRAAGTLPYSKLGSSIYYKLESVEALLESRLTQSIKPSKKPRTHTGGISAPEAKGTQRP